MSCNLQGRIAKHWSAKLRYLCSCSYTDSRPALSLLHSCLCTCMPINEISLRVHLKRDMLVCLRGDKVAVTEWLFQQFTSLNFCKVSCNVYWGSTWENGAWHFWPGFLYSCSVWGVMDTEAGSCPMPYFAGSFSCFCSCLGQLIP